MFLYTLKSLIALLLNTNKIYSKHTQQFMIWSISMMPRPSLSGNMLCFMCVMMVMPFSLFSQFIWALLAISILGRFQSIILLIIIKINLFIRSSFMYIMLFIVILLFLGQHSYWLNCNFPLFLFIFLFQPPPHKDRCKS